MEGQFYAQAAALLGAGIVMGLGGIGPSLGQGLVGAESVKGISKYPENASLIQRAMFLAMGMVETSAIYSLLIALLLIFKF